MKSFAKIMLAGLAVVAGLALLINYTGNSRTAEYLRLRRASLAGTASGPIEIGVAWTDTPADLFLNGVQLAVDEVNAAGGVSLRDGNDRILLRKLRLRIAYERGSDAKSPIRAARKLAAYPGVVAVVGHSRSSFAIPASIVYEKEGILFLAPVATSPQLSQHGFQYVVRTTPTDKEFANRIVQSTAKMGVTNAAILFVRQKYGQTFAEFLRERSEDNGIKIVFSRSYPPMQSDFRSLIANLRETRFDAVFIADEVPLAAVLVKQLREMGVDRMIVGGDGMDSPDLWEVAGRAADNTVVASAFEYNMITNDFSMAGHFVKLFKEKYKRPPNLLAAQGYEAVRVLVAGFEASHTTVPIAVSITLRYTGEWEMLFGKCRFSSCGDVIGKPLFMKKVTNGQFGPVL